MRRFLVFDLETQRSADEVGGWENIPAMKMSVGVIWDSADQRFHTYFEEQTEACIEHLLSGPIVIGFNHIGFDYLVLSGYRQDPTEQRQLKERLSKGPNLDLLLDLKGRIGKRVKLEAVARPTLKTGKSADGLMALRWYKEYIAGDTEKLQRIADYCRQDVEVTRDVYLFGVETQQIRYEDKVEGIKVVSVDWGQEPKADPSTESVQLSF
jgi:DEAD/DEAH box helicase domain-containing protein